MECIGCQSCCQKIIEKDGTLALLQVAHFRYFTKPPMSDRVAIRPSTEAYNHITGRCMLCSFCVRWCVHDIFPPLHIKIERSAVGEIFRYSCYDENEVAHY